VQNSPSLSCVANSLTPTSSDAQGESVIFTVQVGDLRARVTLTKSSKLSFTLDADTTVMVREPQDIIDVSPGIRYKFDSYDPSANVTMTEAKTITLVYKTQYYLTVTTPHGTTSGEGWFDKGATAKAGVNPLTVAGPPGVQYVFTGWSGNASGTTSPSDPITMDCPKTAIANWKTQYLVTFAQAGLDDSAIGTVITVDGSAKAYGDLPFSKWVDKDGSVSYAYESVVSSSTSGKRFSQESATRPTSPITVNDSVKVIGNYKTQYQITFDQTGVEADFTGTILTIDNKGYMLPESFWWDSGTTHTFAFQSPLVVTPNAKKYVCSFVRSTTGLSPDQSSSISVSKSGSVTGNYKTQYELTMATNFGTTSLTA